MGRQPQPDREALTMLISHIQASLLSLGALLSGLLDVSRLESGPPRQTTCRLDRNG